MVAVGGTSHEHRGVGDLGVDDLRPHPLRALAAIAASKCASASSRRRRCGGGVGSGQVAEPKLSVSAVALRLDVGRTISGHRRAISASSRWNAARHRKPVPTGQSVPLGSSDPAGTPACASAGLLRPGGRLRRARRWRRLQAVAERRVELD